MKKLVMNLATISGVVTVMVVMAIVIVALSITVKDQQNKLEYERTIAALVKQEAAVENARMLQDFIGCMGIRAASCKSGCRPPSRGARAAAAPGSAPSWGWARWSRST